MKTLGRSADAAEIVARLQRLRSASERRWGVMSAHQMVCHLIESNRMAIGTRPIARTSGRLTGTLRKWMALRAPVTWPRGLSTVSELDQRTLPAPAVAFDDAVAEAVRLTRQLAGRDGPWPPHPFFGAMSRADWLRWGYLHNDHHLRQFGE